MVGAGIGGLAASIELAAAGCEVEVYESAAEPGGKMRQLPVAGRGVDAGPTVFTMRWIFDELLRAADTALQSELTLHSADVLARHAWCQGGRLDLYADRERSAVAIGDFAGDAEARGYRDFCARSADIYATLREPFIAGQRPGMLDLSWRVGLSRIDALWRTAPWQTLWKALAQHLQDPRLRQLFGRYATYIGSSPLSTPATRWRWRCRRWRSAAVRAFISVRRCRNSPCGAGRSPASAWTVRRAAATRWSTTATSRRSAPVSSAARPRRR